MDASQAIALIKQGLGFRTDLDAQIVQALNDAQDEFEGAATLPWFLVTSVAIPLAVGASSAPIPAGFIREVEDEPMAFADSGRRVAKYPFDDLLASSVSSLSYALRADELAFRPAPQSQPINLVLHYYKSQPDITAGTTAAANAWLANVPKLLVGRSGAMLAADLEDEAGQKRFEATYGRWKGWLMARIVERESANMPYALGRNR